MAIFLYTVLSYSVLVFFYTPFSKFLHHSPPSDSVASTKLFQNFYTFLIFFKFIDE